MAQMTATSKEDAAFLFARYGAGLRYEDLPSEIVDMTKRGILDTLAVMLAASGTTSEVKVLVEMMREIGGKKECTVLGFGDKVPFWHAGYLNGSMAHCLDYDDLHAEAALQICPNLLQLMDPMLHRLGVVGPLG